MAGYTIQMYNGDWFISLINIIMWCVCVFGKAGLSFLFSWWLSWMTCYVCGNSSESVLIADIHFLMA